MQPYDQKSYLVSDMDWKNYIYVDRHNKNDITFT